jgi:hypothetical protein
MNVVSMHNNETDTQSIEGVEEAEQKVLKFVKAATESTELEGTLEFELLMHGAGQDQDDPVWSSEWEPGDNISRLTKEIVEAAVEDASGYPNGVFKYVLKVVGVKARAVFSLRVNSVEDEDIEDIDELPNKKGVLQMLMRHQEKTMRIAIGSVAKTMQHMSKQLEKKDERIEAMEARQMDMLKMTEDLISGRHARDLELRKLDREDQRKEQALGMLMNTLPVLATKVIGAHQAAQMAPGGPTPLENVIEGLMGSVTQEQFQAIYKSGLFTPEQIMALAQIAEMLKARQEAAQNGQNTQNPGAEAPKT